MGPHGVVIQSLERCMTADELMVYVKYQSFHVSGLCGEGECLVNCPFCAYFEIHQESQGMDQMYCKNVKCSKISCKYCKQEMKIRQNPTTEEEVNDRIRIFAEHKECAELGPLKDLFMK